MADALITPLARGRRMAAVGRVTELTVNRPPRTGTPRRFGSGSVTGATGPAAGGALVEFAPARELALLREMLSERDRRIADKDATIDALRQRLAAVEEERRTMLRQLSAMLAERQSEGGWRRTVRIFGRLLDLGAALTLAPPLRAAQGVAAADSSERARAEKALLELIARSHRRWMQDGEGN
jgi:hypothetical protein